MNELIVGENEEKILPFLWMGDETEIKYDVRLSGSGAKITFLALLLGRNLNKLKLDINIYHEKPETKSRIVVRGALSDSAHIDFDGLVKIDPGAKGTNAWLAAHILLLSKHARGRAVPSLEILENDIKAGHATTVGRVNDLELFYLMSRGLSEKASKSLIVQGFFNNMLEEFPKSMSEKVRGGLENFYNVL